MTRGKESLREDIARRRTPVAVVGLGYVGAPLAVAVAEAGFEVVGLEKDEARIAGMLDKESAAAGEEVERIPDLVAAGRLRLTSDPLELRSCGVACICVPTPLTGTRDPDLSRVREAAAVLERAVAEGDRPKLVILESTTYPGTTREVVLPILEKNGLRSCRDFHLAYSPERVDPGNRRWGITNTPKLVGGLEPCCLELAATFYSSFVERVVKVSMPETAEMAKLLENIFRGVNIALVNELWMLCDRMGIDVWEVVEAASTKPFGFMAFRPGPGLGGHCIPVDPFYLAWKAREYDFHTEFIELAGKVNVNMPYFVAGLVMRELNRRGRSLRGSRVLVLGVAYKADVPDTRETPAAKVMELLAREGAELYYHDPYVPEFDVGGRKLRSIDLEPGFLAACHCVVILTDHSGVDYRLVASSGVPVVDTRNALSRFSS